MYVAGMYRREPTHRARDFLGAQAGECAHIWSVRERWAKVQEPGAEAEAAAAVDEREGGNKGTSESPPIPKKARA